MKNEDEIKIEERPQRSEESTVSLATCYFISHFWCYTVHETLNKLSAEVRLSWSLFTVTNFRTLYWDFSSSTEMTFLKKNQRKI